MNNFNEMREAIDGLTKRLNVLENNVNILVGKELLSPEATTKALDIALADPVHTIITVVAHVHGIKDVKDITVNKNGSQLVRSARRMAMHLCKEYHADRLKNVSKYFGVGNHGTTTRTSSRAKNILRKSALFRARYERARKILDKFFGTP